MEIQSKIFQLLDVKSYLSLTSTCKYHHQYKQNQQLWKYFTLIKYNTFGDYEYFKNRFCSDLNFYRERYIVATCPFHADIVLAVFCMDRLATDELDWNSIGAANGSAAYPCKSPNTRKHGLSLESKEGIYGFSGAKDGTCSVFNIKIATLIKQFKPHKFGLSCFEEYNSHLVTGGWDGKSIIWTIDLQTDQLKSRIFNNHKPVICIKVQGDYLACGLDDGLRIWDLKTSTFVEMDSGLVTCIDYANKFVYGKSNYITDGESKHYFETKVSAMKITDLIHVGTEGCPC
ncbi:hypothetical protein HDV01_001615 [Terramyces sp. JEL0728]|nr:hypothetical protein HDV01_001615 [Terramyces sp. JEL0728]